jgi:toxin ParE1/3/4
MTLPAYQLRISSPASEDLIALLAHSEREFGAIARRRYELLIFKALDQLMESPDRLGSQLLELKMRQTYRSYHLASAKRGSGVLKPRHFIIYTLKNSELLINRILHDSMDLPVQLGSEDS